MTPLIPGLIEPFLRSACLAQLGLASSGYYLELVDPAAREMLVAAVAKPSLPVSQSSVSRALAAYARNDWWQPSSDAYFGLQLAWLLDDLSQYAEHLEQTTGHSILRVDSGPTSATVVLADSRSADGGIRSAAIALIERVTPIEHATLALVDELARGWPSEWTIDPTSA